MIGYLLLVISWGLAGMITQPSGLIQGTAFVWCTIGYFARWYIEYINKRSKS